MAKKGRRAQRQRKKRQARGRALRHFEKECRGSAIVLALGLHPHLISVPHRIHELEHMLDLLSASPDVRFYTGSQLADWYMAALPAPTQI
jgi:hypothetical protein